MAKTEKYFIGPTLLGEIRDTITRVAGMPDKTSGVSQAVRLQELQRPAAGRVRICTFTGSWAINASKIVTFKGVSTTPNTVSALNLFCGLNPSGQCDVSVARDGNSWYLLQPNLTQLPGYSSLGTQVLTIQSGNLRWADTTACA